MVELGRGLFFVSGTAPATAIVASLGATEGDLDTRATTASISLCNCCGDAVLNDE